MKVHYPGRDSRTPGRRSILGRGPRIAAVATGASPRRPPIGTRRGRGWSYGLATAVLIVVFLIANRPLVSGRATGLWDAEGYFTAMQIAVADHARNGPVHALEPLEQRRVPGLRGTASRRACRRSA